MIVEVNQTVPIEMVGMHDIFEIGLPPHARVIPITKPDDRVGTPYIPCAPEKIVAIVMTDREDEPQKFKPTTPETTQIGENVIRFLKGGDRRWASAGESRSHSVRGGFRGQCGVELSGLQRLQGTEYVHGGYAGRGVRPD